MQPHLGVNIDHVATLRQLRGTPYPDLKEAAQLCERAGARQITIHLREDRRHIQDKDVFLLRDCLSVPLNLEMAVAADIVKIARKVVPDWACLVPEKRTEVTTEGGLDVRKKSKTVGHAVSMLKAKGIRVSLFIEPTLASVRLAKTLDADAVELHTGRFCLARQGCFKGRSTQIAIDELARLKEAAELALTLGLRAHAGHGFDYENVKEVRGLRNEQGSPLIEEYNIGHSIICRAVMVGLETAVKEMVALLEANP